MRLGGAALWLGPSSDSHGWREKQTPPPPHPAPPVRHRPRPKKSTGRARWQGVARNSKLSSHMPLPRRIQGLGGPITIQYVPVVAPEDDRLGQAVMESRTIYVKRDLKPEVLVSTLVHEMFHFALWDSGVADIVDKEHVEALCNAAGSMIAAARVWDPSE